MQLKYYPDTDTLYVAFRDAPGVDSREVGPGLVLDLNGDGQPVGIEIEEASRRVDLTTIQTFSLPDFQPTR